jgi:hypothetical protein
MKPGEYKVTVEGVEGVLCTGRINLAAILLQADSEPVSLAMEESKAMELVTVLSIIAGGCESVVWRQQREATERKAEELRVMEALKVKDEGRAAR